METGRHEEPPVPLSERLVSELWGALPKEAGGQTRPECGGDKQPEIS